MRGLPTSALVRRALAFATERHQGQLRKGDGRPFITHPTAVANLLRRHRMPESVVAAGLLHDVLEDTATTVGELQQGFGRQVAALVKAVTEPSKRHPWEYRKAAYLKHLRKAPRGALAISCADKLHNTLSLVRAYRREGPVVWERFSRGVDQKLAYHRSVYAAVRDAWPRCPLLPWLSRALSDLEKIERQFMAGQPKEVECKFLVREKKVLRDAARLKALGPFRRIRLSRQRQVNRYWDTADLRLRRARVALRSRQVGARMEITFKREFRYEKGISQRIEVTAPWPERLRRVRDPYDLEPIPEPVRQVRRMFGPRPLQEVLTLRTDRQALLFSFRRHRVGLDLDQVRVFKGGRVVGIFMELELENLSAEPRFFEEARQALRRRFAGVIRVSRMPKVERGFRLLP